MRVCVIFFLLLVVAGSCFGMISLGTLDKERAAKMGIVMKSRPNGDAGTKVWLEFKQKDAFKNFTYAELRMKDDDGNHQLSAMLRVNPVHHKQTADITSVVFSADPTQLKNCEFWVVCNNAMEGVGYILKVSDFLDLEALK